MKKEGKTTDLGAIRIHNEVICAIASLATLEVEGVLGMSSSLAEGLAHVLGKKTFDKGVKAEINQDKTKISVSVVVKYGLNIPEIVSKVQKNVKKNVEQMTGLKLEEINVNVQGIQFGDDTKTKIKKTEEEKGENI